MNHYVVTIKVGQNVVYENDVQAQSAEDARRHGLLMRTILGCDHNSLVIVEDR